MGKEKIYENIKSLTPVKKVLEEANEALKDKSKNFEDTDALIEKTVNFSFDVMRSNGIDSFFDLAKFHIQHF